MYDKSKCVRENLECTQCIDKGILEAFLCIGKVEHTKIVFMIATYIYVHI
jgi:hypothetical protein